MTLDDLIGKIINDDCLNVLKDIPDNSIDLICTDCPYRICSGGCTCIAAKNLKRRFIGIEIDEQYAKVANERLEQAQRQQTLF